MKKVIRRGLLTALAVLSVAVPAAAASSSAAAAVQPSAVTAGETMVFEGIGGPMPSHAQEDARRKMNAYASETGTTCTEETWDVRLGHDGSETPRYYIARLTAECGT
ncbi:hypothetical protein [Streptomyces sp. NPDC096030]|uniref:hypothetical protein n=1 Tax=Streptomyces sp. NPDC096030 TaxID=3155423 RepID=UPI00332BA7D1